MSDWRPSGTPHGTRRPQVGDIVAWDRRAWEVTHIADADPKTDAERDRLAAYRPDWQARMQPYTVTLRHRYGAAYDAANDAGDIGLYVPVGAYNPLPAYRDGRVPLCSCHGEPWPCLEADQQAYAEAEMRRTEKALNLMPGCCPACEEPVTSRQKSITFGGPNVRNPLAEGPTYHLRRKCYHAAASYEEAWVKAEPGRGRSLLTLRCEGTVVVHRDGTAECFGAEGSDCPSVYASHRCATACYMQTHGCPRGCSRRGHPGTRVAGRPDHPRAVTRIEEAR